MTLNSVSIACTLFNQCCLGGAATAATRSSLKRPATSSNNKIIYHLMQQVCPTIRRVIKNDVFVLTWTINTIFGINSLDCFTNNNSINCNMNGDSVSREVHSIFVVIIVIVVLLLSYILLVVQIFASVSSCICQPQFRLMIVNFNIGDSHNSDNNIAGISGYFHANGNNTTREQLIHSSQSGLLTLVLMMAICKLFSILNVSESENKNICGKPLLSAHQASNKQFNYFQMQ